MPVKCGLSHTRGHPEGVLADYLRPENWNFRQAGLGDTVLCLAKTQIAQRVGRATLYSKTKAEMTSFRLNVEFVG